jgi:hypothetical protein
LEPLEDRNLLSAPPVLDVVGHLPVVEYNQFIRDALDFRGNSYKDWGNEPTVAVNPLKPNQIAISTFAYGSFVRTGPGATNTSLWYSGDGGATWGIRFPIPRQPAPGSFVPNDQTIAYDDNGVLHGAFLTFGSQRLNVYHGSTEDPNADGVNGRPASVWQWNPNRVNLPAATANHADQPWLALQDNNVYVGYQYFQDGLTAEARVSASADLGATFTADNPVSGGGPWPIGANLGLRLATDEQNNVYTLSEYGERPFLPGSGLPTAVHYRLNMSSDGGLTWKFTTASPNPGGLSVDDGQSLQVGASFGGLNIIFLITALSADPSGAHVYAAYGKRDADNVDRIYLAEFHPDPSNPGTLVERANPVPLSVPGQRGALPSVAVTESGRVFVMYDTFDGTQFHVHLATSADQGLTFADQPLYDFAGLNVGSPGPRQRILGDYQSLIAVDDTVYGSFAGRGNVNDPVTGINTTDMIDPFFFSVPAPDTGHAHLRRSHPAGPPFVDTVPPNPGPLPEDLDGTALAAADAGGAPAPASSAVSEEGTAPPFAGLGRDVTGLALPSATQPTTPSAGAATTWPEDVASLDVASVAWLFAATAREDHSGAFFPAAPGEVGSADAEWADLFGQDAWVEGALPLGGSFLPAIHQ